MRDEPQTVADSSPLIAFGAIARLDIITAVLGNVLVPDAVWREVTEIGFGKPGASAVAACPLLIRRPPIDIPADLRQFGLGAGETEAIALARSTGPRTRVLIDDFKGRQLSQQLGFRVLGSTGLLLLAKQQRVISLAVPLLDELVAAGLYVGASARTSFRTAANE